MPETASFIFHDMLNDFLPKARKYTRIAYTFEGTPAVKDAMEAIGVPHPEVGLITINGAAVDFMHPLHAGDEVEVFPVDYTSEQTVPVKFVLDVHLGKLAKLLRMLGFDTLYETDYTDQDIARLAQTENRIALTRDVGLLKQKAVKWGYWLRSQHANEQLEEVMRRFGLKDQAQPFKRCLTCNGNILQVEKDLVLERLPPKTKLYFDEFYQCACCDRVYWKGSHYERMQQYIEQWQDDQVG